MLNALLLEVECKKKAPKGPPNNGEPEDPKQASPIELLRAAITINTRRQNLIDSAAKYKALTASLASASMAKKAKIDHDLACQKLALAAAENWVKFSLKRWKKLADFAGEHGVPTAKLKTALAYGNQQAGLGNTHLDLLNTDKPLPAVDDLSFDHASHTFKKGGVTYSLDGIIDLMSKAEPAPVPEPAPAAPTEPTPELGAKIEALSDKDKASLTQVAKQAFLSAVMLDKPEMVAPSEIIAAWGGPEANLSSAALVTAQEVIAQASKEIMSTDADEAAIADFASKLPPGSDYKDLAKLVAKNLGKIAFSHTLQSALLKAKAPAPETPEKPTWIEKLDDEQRSAVYTHGVKWTIDALKETGAYPLTWKMFDTLKNSIFGGYGVVSLSPAAVGQMLNELDSVRTYLKLTDIDLIEAQKIADGVVEGTHAASPGEAHEYAKLISQEIAKKLGKWVPYGTLVDITKKATDKLGVSLSSLTATEKEKGIAAVVDSLMSSAWNEGYWPPHPVSAKDVQALFSDAANITISVEAAEFISQSTFDELVLIDDLSGLQPEQLDALVKATGEAVKTGWLLVDAALKAANQIGLVHHVLSPDAQSQLHQKVIAADAQAKKKTPDELGFLAEIKKILSATTVSVDKWGTYGAEVLAQTEWGSLLSLAWHYNIEDHSGDLGITLLDAVEKAVTEVKLKKFDAVGYTNACYAVWDEKAKACDPFKQVFVSHIFNTTALPATYHLSMDVGQALGFEGKWTYTESLFDSWLTKWNEEQAKLSAPPPVVTAPVPGAAPTVAPPPKPSLPPGYSYFYSKDNYKKLSKPEQLADGMFIYLANKCVAALENGALLTAKGEVGPNKTASAVKAIHKAFKEDWATAGITQIGIGLIETFLKNALDVKNQNLSMVGSPNFYSKLLDKYGKSWLATHAKLGMSASLVAAAPKVATPAAATLNDIPALLSAIKAQFPSSLSQWEADNIEDIWNKTVGAGHSFVPPNGVAHVFSKGQYNALQVFLSKAKQLLPAGPGVAPLASVSAVPAVVDPFTQYENIPALWHLMMTHHQDDLDDWEKTPAIGSTAYGPVLPPEDEGIIPYWEKTVGVGKAPTGVEASYLKDFLAKAKKKFPNWTPTGEVGAQPAIVAPVAPVAPVGVTLEISPTAPASTYQALGVGPRDNPLGMTYEEIKAFSSLGKPASSPEMPSADEDWKPKDSFFGGHTSGGSEKWSIGIDVDGAVTDRTFGTVPPADGAWMHKPEKAAFRAFAEVASNRVQLMLGFVGTPDAWVTDFKGKFGSIQKFERATANFRKNHTEGQPWKEGESAIEELQKYFVLNYITSESDDHGGNFAIMPDGRLKGLDRAQAMKFFDSSHSALDYYNLGDVIPYPSYAVQNDSKGMPAKVMKHWANGGSISLMPLTHPSFEAVIARAEAIPSDIYKEMWRPYAEKASIEAYPSHHTGSPALGEASTVPADKTVEGFLEGVNNRRKNVRASIGAMYTALAKTRAQSLKTKGDARPLAEIEAEIRDQLGLDAFLQGVKPAKEVSPVSQADPAPDPTSDEAWNDADLPVMSKVPTAETLAKNGSDGLDMLVGGSDAKGGLAQFWQVGENPFSLVYLDEKARAKLGAKLPDAGTSPGPVPPVKPPYPSMPTIDLPSFEPLTNRDLWRRIMEVSGASSHKHEKDTEVFKTGEEMFRAEKHLLNWESGKDVSTSGYEALVKARKKAIEAANSSDPLIVSSSAHYLKEFDRIGVKTGGSPADLKPASSFPEAERKFTPYVATPDALQAQEEAKKNAGDAYASAYAAALAENNEAKAKIDAKFDADMASYATAKEAFDKLQAADNKLPAIKLKFWPVPKNVERYALQENMGGQGLVSKKSKWDGEYGYSYDSDHANSTDRVNPVDSFEIDLTGLTGQSGQVHPTKRLLVHFVHTQTDSGKQRTAAGRMGSLRVQYPAGSTSAQIKEYSRQVYAHLGLDLRPASKEENELAYLRTMAWLRKIEGYKAPTGLTVEGSEPPGSISDKINFWIEEFKKPPIAPGSKPGTYSWSAAAGGLGYDPRFLPIIQGGLVKKNPKGEVLYQAGPDGKPKPNPFYQPTAVEYDGAGSAGFRRFDITDEEMENYINEGKKLWKTSSALRNKRTTMFNTGTMYSSERRNNMGFMPHGDDNYPNLPGESRWGTSPGADVPTGGSGTVYLYLGTDLPSNEFVEISPKIMLFTPVFSHHSDSYGAKNDYRSGKDSKLRAGSVQESTVVEAMEHATSSAETLVMNKLSWMKWAVKVYPKYGERQKWIDSYKAAGITHMGIDNKPIEEVIGQERS